MKKTLVILSLLTIFSGASEAFGKAIRCTESKTGLNFLTIEPGVIVLGHGDGEKRIVPDDIIIQECSPATHGRSFGACRVITIDDQTKFKLKPLVSDHLPGAPYELSVATKNGWRIYTDKTCLYAQ